jgi:hypothetical protein
VSAASSHTAPASHQVDAHGDVAPLVAAAHLDVAGVVDVQAEEVVRLEEHVAELRVGDALLHPAPHRLLGDHLAHGEVLPDVAQELEQASRPQPVGVVEEEGVVEVEEPLELGPDALQVRLQLVGPEQGTLPGPPPGVAHHARAATGQGQGAVAGQLEPAQGEEGEQVADVEAARRRVEARVHGHPAAVEERQQGLVGDLVQEATPAKLLGEGGHGPSLP